MSLFSQSFPALTFPSCLEPKRTVTFLVPYLVGRRSETLAAESTLVLPKFPVYGSQVDVQVAWIGQEFSAEWTLRFQSARGSCRRCVEVEQTLNFFQ